MASTTSQYAFVDEHPESETEDLSRCYLTAEEQLGLAWKVAGATMAALGVDRRDMPVLGERVAPIIRDLVREYGITVPESHLR